MAAKIYAQGDILLEACDDTPNPECQVSAKGEPVVLAEGEHTGMKHALYDNVTMFRDDALARSGGFADNYLGHITVGAGGAVLEHGEKQGAQGDHAPINVDEGTYRVLGQREHREGETIRAMD
jgi:hypothetical protein